RIESASRNDIKEREERPVAATRTEMRYCDSTSVTSPLRSFLVRPSFLAALVAALSLLGAVIAARPVSADSPYTGEYTPDGKPICATWVHDRYTVLAPDGRR